MFLFIEFFKPYSGEYSLKPKHQAMHQFMDFEILLPPLLFTLVRETTNRYQHHSSQLTSTPQAHSKDLHSVAVAQPAAAAV
jgi:hypothetical protein